MMTRRRASAIVMVLLVWLGGVATPAQAVPVRADRAAAMEVRFCDLVPFWPTCWFGG